ncbi:hypothetical protein M569_16214, partial [Genlisea aurea]
GLRSRSRRVVQDSSVANEKMEYCFWANLPSELLREMLLKVEESESKWPARKNVVACAGVCKSWREVMKELVRAPEVSGKLTFPLSIKQPGPRDSLIQCFIKRNRSTQTYKLFVNCSQALADEGKFLLSARRCWRPTCTDYVISLHSDGDDTYVGKLRSNFLGTKFVVYDALPPHSGAKMAKTRSARAVGTKHGGSVPAGNYPVAHISYELNVLGASRGPRRMQCVMDAIPASSIKPGGVAPTQTYFPLTGTEVPSAVLPFFRSKSSRWSSHECGVGGSSCSSSLVLRNKSPRWHEQLQCWCLNFHGRVTVASVKNFQLVGDEVAAEGGGGVILQFGKVGKDVFTMDFGYPVSAFQAFAICLSSFDTKIACE